MRYTSFIRYLTILLFLSGFIYNSNAALIKSAQDGDWNDPDTWDLGRVPDDGDEIIIDVGHTVIINDIIPGAFQTLDNVSIAIRGVLSLEDPGGIFGRAALLLDVNSLLVIENGGEIVGTGSEDEYIRFGGNLFSSREWQSDQDGDISGPSYINDSGITAGETPDGYIPLPIDLISFTAKLSGRVVEIDWATAAEINNDFFTVERSEDGINWSMIGEELGDGDSHVRLDYQFIDYDPIPGISYYRLKQTDFDGQFEYFDPVVVLYEATNVFKAFPNPVQNHINVTTSSELENATIFIKSLNGQLLRADQVIISSHQVQLDLDHLPAGVYILEIVFPESNLSTRIIKQ